MEVPVWCTPARGVSTVGKGANEQTGVRHKSTSIFTVATLLENQVATPVRRREACPAERERGGPRRNKPPFWAVCWFSRVTYVTRLLFALASN